MAKKLYVGNLSYTMTSQELRSAFEQYGSVSDAVVLSDKLTGKSRGFGFVTMDDDSAAAAAIQAMHGQDMGGRQIVVNEARPLEERGPRN